MRWALGILLFYGYSCAAVDIQIMDNATRKIREIIELANQRKWEALDQKLDSGVHEGMVLRSQIVGFLQDFGGKNLLPQSTVFAAWKAMLNHQIVDDLELEVARKQLLVYHDPEAVKILLESSATQHFWNEVRPVKSVFPLRYPSHGDSITESVKNWLNKHPNNHATHDIQRLLKEAKSCQRDLA